jgi:2,4-dienoyl-CoA reductase-like NADH-dependent reductase (Old Yellow Enzyme family)
MKTLFDATAVKGVPLNNRFFRSATWERLADAEGRVTPGLAAVYEGLARGGVGGIIASATFMHGRAKALPGQIGLCDESFLPGHRTLTETAHQAGAAILSQLAFVGQDGAVWTAATARAEDLDGLPALFAKAAVLAREAGYDGAQIHAAHGYFLSQFTNPAANTRTDAYGGSPEARRSLLLAIYAAMRRAVGENFLLAAKLDCRDLAGTPGLAGECLGVAGALDAAGIDLVEISGLGGNKGIVDGPDQAESVFREEAAAEARAIRAPVILVGANRSLPTMAAILGETDIAYFALSRPLLREPGLVGRWAAGDGEASACISCGACYDDDGNGCVFTRD